MHSVALVSGNPNSLVAMFKNAGSPKPNATVRNTENDMRSAARNRESGAIFDGMVYLPFLLNPPRRLDVPYVESPRNNCQRCENATVLKKCLH